MSGPRILVAGIGNIFLGDDAFGVEVVQRLVKRKMPSGVRVIDFGIRGIDLTYALLDGYDLVILVDTVQRGERPGTIYLIAPNVGEDTEESTSMPQLDLHDLDPAKVLATARAMGGKIDRVLLVGCEPLMGDESVPSGLSAPVAAAVDEAIQTIESLIAELRDGARDVPWGDTNQPIHHVLYENS